jgi:hypothetical protein
MATEDEQTRLIPAGIDIGTRNARLSVISESDSQPCIVPNEIGQRYTLALSIEEPKAEADPMNDQYWDKPKKGSKLDEVEAPVSHIHGDAARKTLNRLKKPLKPHFVSSLIQDVANCDPSDGSDVALEGGEEEAVNVEEEKQNKLRAAESFFSHLSTQTSHASGTTAHPSSLRYVLSVPPTQSKAETETFIKTVENGTLKSIEQVGWDSAPEILKSPNLNKREKKQIIQEAEKVNRVLAVITNPIAVAHAHGVFDADSKSMPKWQNMLIIDWGASALTLTHLQNLGSTQMTSMQETQTQSASCGVNILNILVKHAAELFERNKRGMIPRGETLLNKKAKAKLEVACEDALRSFGYSQKAHVTVDGLIDGIDCQIEIMLARFEMLLATVLKTAEGMIRDFVASSGVQFDGVLSSGGIMRMKCVSSMINRLFQDKWRGMGVGDVAPEEAVALGCAKFARSMLESPLREAIIDNTEDSTNLKNFMEEDVVLSPVGIGLSLQEGDPAALIMIEKRTPLPALVTKNIPLAGCSSSIGVTQISEEKQVEKMIGKIEDFDKSASSLEVTMELSCKGQLSVLINGGPTVVM